MTCSTRRTLWTAVALLALAAAALPAHAAVYIVTKTADTADGACNSDCSLREAILAANANPGPDFILLGPGTYTLTRAGAGEDLGSIGDLDIRDDVFIVGASAERTIIDGGQIDRVFDVLAEVRAQIVGVTIRNGKVAGPGGGVRNAGNLELSRSIVSGNTATTAAGFGGGIWSNGSGSDLTVTQSTLAGNSADGGGGGLAVGNQAEVSNTTVSGNRANGFGGGLYAFANTAAVFDETTVTGNISGQKGGGIFGEVAPFIAINNPELIDTILAGNSAASQPDCAGAVQSGGHNLLQVGFDCNDFNAAHHDMVGTTGSPVFPGLGPLTNNGGTTPTHALLAGSPALGKGSACGDTDQRGETRPATGCDIGAFQTGPDCLTGGPTLCLNNDRFRVTAQWRKKDGTSGSGQGVSLTGDSGYFWFFDPSNVELTGKVLNGCGFNNKYWVFLSGLTNVEVTVTVTDTQKGVTKTYHSPLGTVFPTTLDTAAFATCP